MDSNRFIQYQPQVGVRELDLSACHHPNSIAHKINSVPVVKGSTAFFTFLRANLVLSSSSCANTPQLEPMQTTASLPASFTKPSASTLRHSRSSSTSSISSNGSTGSRRRQRSPPSPTPSACSLDSLPLDDDIPPLSLEPLETTEDKVEGLRLVADSVAQMHQRAFSTVLFHPLCLAGYAATLAGLYQAFGAKSDLGSCIIVACGVTMSYILLVRYLTSGYIRLAEQTNWWSWMTGEAAQRAPRTSCWAPASAAP
uniref:Transmembrane protein n=1 Tax=Bionectria ochroleuca TaxID=29856 RepID=A0A8H7NN97_BIOOC